MKKTIIVLLALMLAALPVFSTGSSEKAADSGVKAIRVSWWGGDARHKALLNVIDAFEKANPDVKVEPEYSAFAQYRDKFTIQLTSGAAPDVMAVDQPWCDAIVKQGDFFLDLNAYKSELKLDSFDSSMIDNYSIFNEKTLFLPAGINGMGSLVDVEMLSKYGFDISNKDFTWDDLFELAEAFELVDRCYKEKVFQPIQESAVYNNTMTQNPTWLDRKMFMILGRTSVMTETASRRAVDGKPTTTGYVMPQLRGEKETGIEVRPSCLYAINKSTANPDAAVRFLAFMLTSKEGAEYIGSNYSVPAREESRAWVSGVLDPSAVENVEYSLANAGSKLNDWSSNSEVEALFTEIMEKIAYGQYKNMLEAADETISRIGMIVSAKN